MPSPHWIDAVVVILSAVTLLWLLSLALKDVSIVDIWWGPGYPIIFATLAGFSWALPLRAQVMMVLLLCWGLRLGLFLAWRNLGHGEDSRYQAMRARDPAFAWTSLVKVFWLQGSLQLLISLPLYWIVSADSVLTLWDQISFVVLLAGILIETLADLQLARFKADPNSKGQVMDRGLWAWSRHPNYFGNALIWLGVAAVGLGANAPLWTLLGPALMVFLLLKVSGVAMLESTITERRPAYRDYQERVSAFVLWPPKGRRNRD